MKLFCYSIQRIHQIFPKCYGFISFAKCVSKIVGKNVSRNFSGKNSQRPLDDAQHHRSTTEALKIALKMSIQAEATRNLIGNKFTSKMTKNRIIQRKSQIK